MDKATAAERAQRREKALSLRLQGLAFRQIARRLKVAPATVHNDVDLMLAEMADQHSKEAAHLRALQTRRYEKLLSKIWPKAEAGDYQAVDRCVSLLGRIDKVNGLDDGKSLAFWIQQNHLNVVDGPQTLADVAKARAEGPQEPLIQMLQRFVPAAREAARRYLAGEKEQVEEELSHQSPAFRATVAGAIDALEEGQQLAGELMSTPAGRDALEQVAKAQEGYSEPELLPPAANADTEDEEMPQVWSDRPDPRNPEANEPPVRGSIEFVKRQPYTRFLRLKCLSDHVVPNFEDEQFVFAADQTADVPWQLGQQLLYHHPTKFQKLAEYTLERTNE